jgi:probable F420-dependent oxidoreductase
VTGIPLDDWRGVGLAARTAEEAGFEGLVSFEISHDPFTPLAFAAVATERIELSTAIAVAFPRSPMVVANVVWDLQAQSGGRFALGLGAQVKGHNERRFSVKWSPPVPRLREYVEALRAIWRCWEKGEKLHFEGEHYRFTLMTPEFSPQPTGISPAPISIAAVGPDMLRMAGRVCDGVHLHGFCTRRYLEEVCLPRIEEGLEKGPLTRANFHVTGGGFLATGPDEEAARQAMEEIRYRVAFYGSTRTYLPVFQLHGLEELGARLHERSERGEWSEMAAEVPDDVVRLFAAVAPYDQLPAEIERRFGGVVDTVMLSFAPGTDAGLQRELMEDIRRIATPFEGYRTEV